MRLSCQYSPGQPGTRVFQMKAFRASAWAPQALEKLNSCRRYCIENNGQHKAEPGQLWGKRISCGAYAALARAQYSINESTERWAFPQTELCTPHSGLEVAAARKRSSYCVRHDLEQLTEYAYSRLTIQFLSVRLRFIKRRTLEEPPRASPDHSSSDRIAHALGVPDD
jgi:hypothetical protein